MTRSARVLLGLAVGATAAGVQSTPSLAALDPGGPHPSSVAPPTAQGRHTITGIIFGENRRPVADVYVELTDDTYSTLGRARTSGSGRYQFGGLSQGRYKVKVLAYGTDYMEQTKEVELVSASVVGAGATTEQVDFYLKFKESANTGPFAAPGAVFAQEVPSEAKKFYEKGVVELREKREKEGFESLKRALEIFPTYFQALDRLGTEYVVRGHHEAAYVLLTKSVEVNPRSYSSTVGLGLSQYYLKQNDQAIENLRRATTLHNKSANAHLWLGMALHRAGKLDEAEANYKRARELSQNKLAEAHWQVARLYSDQKRYGESADALELFLKSQPDSRDAEKIREMIRQLREKVPSK